MVVLTGLTMAACLAGSAQAAKGPVIYDVARAVPTRSGDNVRITVFTNRAKKVSIRVDGSEGSKASPYGKGCGELRCEKWRLHTERSGSECYDLRVRATRGPASDGTEITVCEPFRGGSV